MMDTFLALFGIITLAAGSLFTLIGILGMIRMPDVYTRLQATGKVSVLGAVLVLLAAISLTPLSLGKGLLLIALILISAPAVSHAIASAAYRTGIPLAALPDGSSPRDDLRSHLPKVERVGKDLFLVRLGEGRLGLYHRPGKNMISNMKYAKIDVVVTLLNDSEGAQTIGNRVAHQGLQWIWIPMPDGKPPSGDLHKQLAAALPDLSDRLDKGQTIIIHCSAGIHRTGMVALALLRWRGMSEEDALTLLAQMRSHTYTGLRDNHKKWANQFSTH